MSASKFVGGVALKAILVKDGLALISHDKSGLDFWELPGGRLHVGEDLEVALHRELLEELGVQVRVGQLVYSEQYHQTRDGSPHLLLAYEVTLVDPEAEFKLEPTEVEEVRWIEKNELEKFKIYGNCLNALRVYFSD